MRCLRLLIAGCLLALIPAYTGAAPRTGPIMCDTVKGLDTYPIIRYVNKFFENFFQFVDHTTVDLDGVRINLHICAPDKQEAGDRLNKLARILPVLQMHSGLPYQPTGQEQPEYTIIIADRSEIPVDMYGADGPIDRFGNIWLAYGSDDRDIAFAGAHLWANGRYFADAWMIPGYADYLARLAIGYPQQAPYAGASCNAMPLFNWNGRDGSAACAAAAGTIFRDLATALDAEQVRAAVGTLSTGSRGVTSTGLLDVLEDAGGKDLSPIMRGRVFPAQMDQQLDWRKALRLQRDQARALAAGLGVALPAAVAPALDSWDFASADAWLSPLIPLLESAATIDSRCEQLALPCDRPWEAALATPKDAAGMVGELQEAKAMLDLFAMLRNKAAAHKLDLPGGISSEAAALHPAVVGAIRQALDILMRVDGLEPLCKREGVTCMPTWHTAWNTGRLADADREIGAWAKMLNGAATLAEECGDVANTCRQVWQKALQPGGVAAAQKVQDQLRSMLADARMLEAEAMCRRWDCAAAWRATFSLVVLPDQGIAPDQVIPRVRAALPGFHDVDQIAPPAEPLPIWLLDTVAGRDPKSLLARTHTAFAQGDFERADNLAQLTLSAQQNAPLRRMLMIGLLIVLAFGITALIVRWYVRRPVAVRPTTNSALLSELLARPPDGVQK